MTSNSVTRFLTENKKVPVWVNIGLYAVNLNIFYSFLCMSLSVFLLHPEWDSQEAQNHLPIIGLLAPYSFYLQPEELSYFWGAAAIAWIWGAWLFSTRLQSTNKTVVRRMISFFLAWSSFSLIIIFYSLRLIKVIGYEKVVSYHFTIEPKYQDMMHIGSLQIIGYFLLLIPVGVMFSFTVWLIGQYKEDKRIQEWFRTYKFESSWIGRFGEESINKFPDIQLARSAETNAPVVMQGESRQLGTLLIGPPGSGKTSIKIKTAFRTDLGHIQRMINAYPTYIRRYGYGTEEFIKNMANHLIGSIIIEPAKDLCDDAYELAMEHNIPEDFVVYLDPSNPNTPGFNLMVGPTAEVVETITSVLESVAETKDEFFKQAARAVLKHYVYLLKFAQGDNCTILDLDDLYQDPRRAMDLLEGLEKTVPLEKEIDTMDQDGQIHWIIVKKIIRWFQNEGLSIQFSRDGMIEKYPAGHEHAGKPKVTDLQFEFTRQTRNLLSDITKNPYLARILYAENAVDLNKLFTKGGILLVNTDLSHLKALSAIFGKLVLLCVQNAVFRRKGNEKTRPMVSFYADEFYDYMNEDFLQLTSQGRKYKFAPLVACQSLTQFGVKFGKDFTESMLGTIRNTIVYGGTSLYDTEMLSKYLGTEVIEELQIRESYTPTYMDTPSFTVGESISLKEQEIATSDDIMFQEFRYSYIRMVDDKSSKKAIRAVGDFVDPSESDKWKKAMKPEALNSFLEDWRKEEAEDIIIETNEENELNFLRKELDDLNIAQEEIRNEQDNHSEEDKSVTHTRINPYIQKETSAKPSKEIHVLEAKKEVAVSTEIMTSKRNEPLKLFPLLEEENDQKELHTPPPAVKSPFMASKHEIEEPQSKISFSEVFGSKEKEKLSKVTTPKKEQPIHTTTFADTFQAQETKDPTMFHRKNNKQKQPFSFPEFESSTLKEVSLDENALNFINQLKKNSQCSTKNKEEGSYKNKES